jgi:hypothetical protein
MFANGGIGVGVFFGGGGGEQGVGFVIIRI